MASFARLLALRRWAIFGLVCGSLATMALLALTAIAVSEAHYVFFNRDNLPDLGPFTRFELPTTGHVYDATGTALIELAHEYREIARYADIPPVVRDAILAVEDKRFFSHDGVDKHSLPRMLGKVRVGFIARQFFGGGLHDIETGALFPQGGSTITQQLVRGSFLRRATSQESSDELRHSGLTAAIWSSLLGARSVNMLARKREELRLAIWLEQDMRARFGSKRKAKEEILARYAALVYMGNGQYGFARAAEYYFGRKLASFTVADADKAAVLAGIPKSPREYAPAADNTSAVVRRRDQTLTLMRVAGFLSPEAEAQAIARPLLIVGHESRAPLQAAPAVVAHVFEEFARHYAALRREDLLLGRIQVYATADTRVQEAVNNALERGLDRYETRHPKFQGMTQGSVVVLHNRDARILAEAGGRLVVNGRLATYSDFNRVTRSRRQPGSAMKPIVYLTALRRGAFTLDTLVPDFPISVPDGEGRPPKWIANYDGQFKGPMPLRQALAESRNAVAIWLTERIGLNNILRTARSLGVTTPLAAYPTTALGASEMSLLELANAYRTMASGISAEPYVIGSVVRDSGEVVASSRVLPVTASIDAVALALIQEGLRGVIRLPGGTAHALDSRQFPIAIMGKTGTTNEFRDAIFVGSTYGADGITVAVRVGFDDNRSLGPRETGGKVALPIFREVMLAVYRDGVLGASPVFPRAMEERITFALQPREPLVTDEEANGIIAIKPWAQEWLLRNGGTLRLPIAPQSPLPLPK